LLGSTIQAQTDEYNFWFVSPTDNCDADVALGKLFARALFKEIKG